MGLEQTSPHPIPEGVPATSRKVRRLPARMHPGAPHPRLWEAACSLSRQAQTWLRLQGCTVQTTGAGPEQPTIYWGQRRSDLDLLVALSVIPCIPVVDTAYRQVPLLGAMLRSRHALFVETDNAWSGAAVIRQMQTMLRAGVSVLVFPELSRPKMPWLSADRGVFGVARRLSLPLVPLAIAYDDERSPSSHEEDCATSKGWQGWLRPNSQVRLDVGAPLYPGAGQALGMVIAEARRSLKRMQTPFAELLWS